MPIVSFQPTLNIYKFTVSSARVKRKMNDYENSVPKLNFFAMGIKKGAKLKFDNGPETVTVHSQNRVIYRDKLLALRPVTKELLGVEGAGRRILVTHRWRYKGKPLRDLY